MCVVALAWQYQSNSLLVAANRDEYFSRPSRAASRWEDAPHVFGGRDEEAGGSWLACTTTGRLAAVTNFRDPTEAIPQARSRGELVADFVKGNDALRDYLDRVRSQRTQYRGFNLVLADCVAKQCVIYESRRDLVIVAEPGVYAISNGPVTSQWPKSRALGRVLHNTLTTNSGSANNSAMNTEQLLHALTDRSPPPDSELPDTGIGRARERALGAIFVDLPPSYGTRASTVLSFGNGRLQMTEQSYLHGVPGQQAIIDVETKLQHALTFGAK